MKSRILQRPLLYCVNDGRSITLIVFFLVALLAIAPKCNTYMAQPAMRVSSPVAGLVWPHRYQLLLVRSSLKFRCRAQNLCPSHPSPYARNMFHATRTPAARPRKTWCSVHVIVFLFKSLSFQHTSFRDPSAAVPPKCTSTGGVAFVSLSLTA